MQIDPCITAPLTGIVGMVPDVVDKISGIVEQEKRRIKRRTKAERAAGFPS